MKVNTYGAFQHISPFVSQLALVKDYKKDSLQSIRCFITNNKHQPVMLSGFRDHDAIKVIARMMIDMVDPDTNVMKDAEFDYSHSTISLVTGNIVIQHKLVLVAGDSTYSWEWIFADEAEVTE